MLPRCPPPSAFVIPWRAEGTLRQLSAIVAWAWAFQHLPPHEFPLVG